MIVIMKALDRCLFDSPVHPFHLPICPGMVDLGEALLNVMFLTCAGQDVLKGEFVTFPVCELNTIIGKNGMDFIGNGINEPVQEYSQLDRF